jgi:hypothetical protein
VRRNLWDAFAADRIDQRELQNIIQRHFPSGSQPAKGEVVYPGDGPPAITLRFSKNNRLTHVEAGPSLTHECEAMIIDVIKDALTATTRRVLRQVLFAGHKLTGAWRYKDELQITPVPPEAPQLTCLLGDHPFILETKITCTNDGSTTQRRAAQLAREHELLLAGIVNSSVHQLPARPFHGYWVMLPNEGYKTAYLMPGYHANIPEAAEDFTPIESSAPVLPPAQLFGPYSMSAGTPFTVPENLTETFDAYHALQPATRQGFLRSCHWLQYANHAFLHSYSAAFMAIVTAAEVLFPQQPKPKCLSCGQVRHRLRSAFAQLLERSLTVLTSHRVGEDRTIQTRLKHLYDTRSSISHGADLRGWDLPSEFTPRSSQDDDDLRTLLRVMPYTLAQWLREEAGRTAQWGMASSGVKRRSRKKSTT